MLPIRMCLATRRIAWRCLALAAVLSCIGPARAETPWPLKTPAELKTLHGPTFTGLHILNYCPPQEAAEAGAAAATVIGIGRDIMFRDDGGNRRVIDLRSAASTRSATSYINYPMAADIVWFDAELFNRVGLGKALAAAGLDQEKQSVAREPFWDAIELKVTVPNSRLRRSRRARSGRNDVRLQGPGGGSLAAHAPPLARRGAISIARCGSSWGIRISSPGWRPTAGAATPHAAPAAGRKHALGGLSAGPGAVVRDLRALPPTPSPGCGSAACSRTTWRRS